MAEIEIIPNWERSGWWGNLLLIGRGREGQISPEAIGHELAHKKSGQLASWFQPQDAGQQFYWELRAWYYALRDAPEGDWDRDIVKESLQVYIDGMDEAGESHEEIKDAKAAIQDLLIRFKEKFK